MTDFRVDHVNNFRCYINTYYISGRRHRKIIIESGGKEYRIYPDEGLIPDEMTLEEIVNQINKSPEATIWVAERQGLQLVAGIKTEYFSVPPSKGVEFYKRERRLSFFNSGVLFCFGDLLLF